MAPRRQYRRDRRTRCPKCHIAIMLSSLEDHLLVVHRLIIRKKKPSRTSTPKKSTYTGQVPTSAKKPDWLQPPKPPFFSPNKQESGGYKKGKVICPVCHGDGGAAGQCYKCGGLQWVKASASTPSNTTTSKKTRMRDWVHPLVRDPDGRFRSEPMYDRYDDESGPEEESDS